MAHGPSPFWRIPNLEGRRSPRPLEALLALAACLLGAAVLLMPLPLWFGERCWGGRFDFYTNLWFCWYLKEVVASGHLPAHVDLLLYPVSEDFFFAYGHCFVELLTVPLQWMTSLTVAYNLLSVLALGLSGFGAFLLCQYATGSRTAALVGAFFFEGSNYLYSELVAGSVEVAFACWIPLYLLCYLRMQETRRVRDLLLAALMLFLAAGSNFLYGIMLCMVTAVQALWQAIRDRDLLALSRPVLVVALFLLALSPYLLLMFEHVPERGGLVPGEMAAAAAAHARFSDGWEPLARYDFQSRGSFEALEVYLNSARLPNFWDHRLAYDPHESAPSPILWSLALVGALLGGRRVLLWTALALASLVMSLGPFLRTNDLPAHEQMEMAVRLPFFYLYNHVPLVSMIYRPYRFHALTVLAMAVLAAVAWRSVSQRIPRGGWTPLALFAGALFLVNPLLMQPVLAPAGEPLPLASTEVPAYYQRLKAEPGDFAIMDLPFYGLPPSLNQSRYIYFQTVHGKKILSTVFIRPDTVERFLELYRSNSMIRWLVDAGEGSFPQLRIRGADVDWLLEKGYRYAILHSEFDEPTVNLVNGSERKQLYDLRQDLGLRELFGEPRDEGDGLLVFDLRNFRRRHPGQAEVSPMPAGAEVDPLLDDRMVLSISPGGALELEGLESQRTLAFWASPVALGDRDRLDLEVLDPAGRVLGRRTLRPDRWSFLKVEVPPGTARVTLAARDVPPEAAVLVARAQGVRR